MNKKVKVRLNLCLYSFWVVMSVVWCGFRVIVVGFFVLKLGSWRMLVLDLNFYKVYFWKSKEFNVIFVL